MPTPQKVTAPDYVSNDTKMERRPFVPLKLSGHGRKRTPPGFLGLDRVLDRIGENQHPQTWGRLPGWEFLPFRFDARTRTYRTYRDLRLVRGKPVVRTVALSTPFTKAELRVCSQLYRIVCERLLEAFETSTLPAHALQRPFGLLEKITASGLWSMQGTWAFYTGLVVVQDSAAKPTAARVLVREDDLDRWLRKHETSDAQQQLRETRQHIGRVIGDFMEETGCRLTRKQVREVGEKVLGKDTLQSKTAFADVWTALPAASGGAPRKDDRNAFETHREALVDRIRTAT